MRQDRLILERWHLRAVIESWGWFVPLYLELCYLLVYGLPAYCIGVLYAQRRRDCVDLFFVIYLAGTLGAYALFPYFPSQPPRIVFPGIDNPGITTWVRDLNLYILTKATIHVGVFPSAHVSSAFSAAWGMFLIFRRRKVFGWALAAYAISVSLATIYGRYHYAADVLAGFAVSLVAATICLSLAKRTGLNASPRPLPNHNRSR
jgi:membrane-associated phospholipid phosphatase